ncbi:MAG: MliC family protein [Blastocatellales bacterium]
MTTLNKQRSVNLTSFVLAAAAIFFSAFFAIETRAQSFDCGRATTKVEKIICEDDVLARLDTEMNSLYQQALAKANARMKTTIRNEQRNWIRGRNACGSDGDARPCINEFYTNRIDYLKRLIAESAPGGPVTFRCSENAEVVATFTGSNAVRIEIGDTVINMKRSPSGSGAKYVSGSNVFWTKGNEATLELKGKVYNCSR